MLLAKTIRAYERSSTLHLLMAHVNIIHRHSKRAWSPGDVNWLNNIVGLIIACSDSARRSRSSKCQSIACDDSIRLLRRIPHYIWICSLHSCHDTRNWRMRKYYIDSKIITRWMLYFLASRSDPTKIGFVMCIAFGKQGTCLINGGMHAVLSQAYHVCCIMNYSHQVWCRIKEWLSRLCGLGITSRMLYLSPKYFLKLLQTHQSTTTILIDRTFSQHMYYTFTLNTSQSIPLSLPSLYAHPTLHSTHASLT